MKKHLIPLLALLMLPLAACHDDKDNLAALENKVYSGRDGVEITFNGTQMAGKSAAIAVAGNEAAIDYYSELDFASLSEALKDLKPIPAPGVLPGSPRLAFKTPLSIRNGKYAFSGSGETDFVTYNYSGTVTDKLLTTAFTDVLLKNQTFAGTAWAPMKASGLPTADTQPIRIVWETSLPIPIPGLQGTIQDILRMLVNVPFIPVYNNTAEMSITQVIENGLRTLAFDKDGNLPVTYLQTANGASVFTLAPKCTFQYVPLSEASIRLYVNPTDVLSLILLNNTNRDPNIPDHPFGKAPGNVSRALGADGQGALPADLMELLGNLAQMVAPMLAEGIPMAAVRSGDSMALYIPTEVMLPLLKQGIVPLLKNQALRAIVADYVNAQPELSKYSAVILGLFDALPTLLDQTTTLEFGLNLVSTK